MNKLINKFFLKMIDVNQSLANLQLDLWFRSNKHIIRAFAVVLEEKDPDLLRLLRAQMPVEGTTAAQGYRQWSEDLHVLLRKLVATRDFPLFLADLGGQYGQAQELIMHDFYKALAESMLEKTAEAKDCGTHAYVKFN